jgi:hypothetical protein
MKEENKTTQHQLSWGTPFVFLTTLVFLVLKLTHYIDWNWWWIFAPLWIPIAVALVIIIIWAIILIITKGVRGIK